eukprot:symbB.v1.2.033095.t2/scaffold4063.1/size45366/1
MKVQADVFTYSALIGAFSRGSDFSKALQHFQAMEVAMIEADVTCFTSLLSACEKSQRVSDALEIFESMKARKVMPNHVTYSSLISCCEKSSQVDLAWDFFNEMKITGVKMDTIVYNALISTLEKGRRGREALDLLQEMKLKEVADWAPLAIMEPISSGLSFAAEQVQEFLARTVMRENGSMTSPAVCPNVISYNAVLSACEKSRMWEEALEIFQELLDVSLKPDLCSYNALISAADKCQKCHVALVAFEDMKVSQLQADLITYNALISACRSSHPLLASEFFTSMIQEELQPDVISYIALGATKLPKEMLCTCDARSFTAQLGRIQVEDLLPFYQEIGSRGLQMDGPSYAVLFNTLALRHPSLPWLCDEMRQDFLLRGGPYRENGYNMARDKALSLFQEVAAPDIVTYTALLSCLGSSALLDRCKQLLQRFATSHLRCNVVFLGTVMTAFRRGGQWEESRGMLARWINEGLKVDVGRPWT